MLTFDTAPDRYKHWQLSFNGPIATLAMDVREDAGLSPDYKLKLNSYDLGVDIELADAIQRHPLRAPRGARGHRDVAQGAHLLRRRQHHDAARLSRTAPR
jgi:hypothetical protein